MAVAQEQNQQANAKQDNMHRDNIDRDDMYRDDTAQESSAMQTNNAVKKRKRAQSLRGKPVVEAMKVQLQANLAALPYVPAVHFVRVGEDPASVAYVRGKDTLAKSLGIASQVHVLAEDTPQDELLEVIHALNHDNAVDGILVQFPLPPHLDAKAVVHAIDPSKDVDGLHPVNVGKLWSGEPGLFPCTPRGLVAIMDFYDIPIRGKNMVVVGRSNLVGRPAAGLFLLCDASVTITHRFTQDLAAHTRQADILVVAVGKQGLITADMVKPGAAVLDVGITRVDGKLKGDVAEDVWDIAGHVTPMPGGTGRLTTAMLMDNTYRAAVARRR